MRLHRAVLQTPPKIFRPARVATLQIQPPLNPFKINTSTSVDSTPLQLLQNQRLQKNGGGDLPFHPQMFTTRYPQLATDAAMSHGCLQTRRQTIAASHIRFWLASRVGGWCRRPSKVRASGRRSLWLFPDHPWRDNRQRARNEPPATVVGAPTRLLGSGDSAASRTS